MGKKAHTIQRKGKSKRKIHAATLLKQTHTHLRMLFVRSRWVCVCWCVILTEMLAKMSCVGWLLVLFSVCTFSFISFTLLLYLCLYLCVCVSLIESVNFSLLFFIFPKFYSYLCFRLYWWVVFLMIMATIMVIAMVLMALKIKIAWSWFFFSCCFCLLFFTLQNRFVCKSFVYLMVVVYFCRTIDCWFLLYFL